MKLIEDDLTFDDYEDVFTPGSPVDRAAFFFGRERELDTLHRAIRRKGFHPVVIGNRGVGKTSLVQLAFADYVVPVVTVTCNSSMTFDQFARNALRRLGVNTDRTEASIETEKAIGAKATVLGIGGEASGKQKTVAKQKQLGSEVIDPWRLFLELREFGKKAVIVLDEYDIVAAKNSAFHRGVAELIKTLADNRRECDTRVVVVGIAQSAEVLLGRHQSIERSVKEIYLHPLAPEAIDDFLTSAEERLGFRFKDEVKQAIITASGGYPYFVHLVGQECLDVMHERDPGARLVEDRDYVLATKRAVQEAFRAEFRKYREAAKSLTENDVRVVRELAFIAVDGRATREQLERRILHSTPVTKQEFNEIFEKLRFKKRLIFVVEGTAEVRFIDPLMAPFIRAAFFPGVIPDRNINQLSLFADA
jgi:hypothetical protein